jgi:methylisocitrate lyase
MNQGVVAAPGAFNALVARAVARAGFQACYVSGGATSVAAGVPDVGLLTLEHFCRVIREVADGSCLPVLADADTGFGEAEMVRRTVIEYHRAGAAGLHLEDQVFPKRCGHLDGKALVPTDHMCEKVEWAAKASRDCSDGAFIICARTDARAVDGMDAAIDRARAYVAAGADMIFPEGLASEQEFAQFAMALKGSHVDPKRGIEASRHQGTKAEPYLLANMTEFGKTPLIPLSRFGEMGYDLVIYPVSMLRVAMGAVTRALETLQREGTVEPFLAEMQSRKDLYDLVGYTPGTPWELRV